MRLPRVRFTMRRMMVAVAAVASVIAVIPRSLTPAEWALERAARFDQQAESQRQFAAAKNPPVSKEFCLQLEKVNLQLAGQFRDLARRFAKEGAIWDEVTYHGPYTSLLASGQAAIVRSAVTAKSSAGGPPASIPAGTPCVVVRDGAGDVDDCECFREIEVRILEGTHEGLTVLVEREYLRCK